MTEQSFYDRGVHTLYVSPNLHKKNRNRLISRLESLEALQNKKNVMVLLKGGESDYRYCTDHENLFRQESFFHWAFGVAEPNFFGAINVHKKKVYLFAPELHEDYAIWMGKLKTKQDILNKYQVDEVHWIKDLKSVMKKILPDLVLTLYGKNSDSGRVSKSAYFDGLNQFDVDHKILYELMSDLRVYKTDEEMEVIRFVNQISSEAHLYVMRNTRPGMKEYQLESMFLHYCSFYGGARFSAYTCICGSGSNSAILHYGHSGEANEKDINDGDLCLLDMGCEYHCYGADITCTFPSNGKFSEKQAIIYNAVLKASRTVLESLKPKVSWVDMHILAERVILNDLKTAGLVVGDLDEMVENRVGAIFMPHGLGHFLGLDTHDVGGYLTGCPERIDKAGLRNLRTARIVEERMCLTVEPGCYFISTLLEKAYINEKLTRYLNRAVIDTYVPIGGVRIEDDIFITKNGVELLTQVPRTISDIESIMNESKSIDVDFPQKKFLNVTS